MRVLTIGCPHLPYEVPGFFRFIAKLIKKYKPNMAVLNGDFWDFYGFSRFMKDPDAEGPSLENKKGKAKAHKLFSMFDNANMAIHINLGNHEARLAKKVREAGMPLTVVKSIRELFEVPEHISIDDEILIDEVLYRHGEEYSSLLAAINHYRVSMVLSHLHGEAGILYNSNGIETLWAAHTGCLADPGSEAAAYGRKSRNQPVLSALLVDEGLPLIIPFKT